MIYYVGQDLPRIWLRWYFYFDAAVDGAFKYMLFRSNSRQHGGVITHHSQYIGWSWYSEWNGYEYGLYSLASVVGGWHSIEIDHYYIGDTRGDVITTGDGEPSLAMWIDNVNVVAADGESLGQGGYWKEVDGVWRVYAGSRFDSDPPRTLSWHGNWDDAGLRTIGGNVWMDRLSVSTLGRIGP